MFVSFQLGKGEGEGRGGGYVGYFAEMVGVLEGGCHSAIYRWRLL